MRPTTVRYLGLGLTVLACGTLWAPRRAPAAEKQDAARVVVEVEHLSAPGAAPAVQRSRVLVTGTGFPPHRARGTAQGRLMARRAALVDGYRKIARASSRWHQTAGGRARYQGERITAFVRGAAIERERYFSTGRVEVELSAPPPDAVPTPDTPEHWRRFQDSALQAGMVIVTTPAPRPDREEISRDQWEQLFTTRQSPTPPGALPTQRESRETKENR